MNAAGAGGGGGEEGGEAGAGEAGAKPKTPQPDASLQEFMTAYRTILKQRQNYDRDIARLMDSKSLTREIADLLAVGDAPIGLQTKKDLKKFWEKTKGAAKDIVKQFADKGKKGKIPDVAYEEMFPDREFVRVVAGRFLPNSSRILPSRTNLESS